MALGQTLGQDNSDQRDLVTGRDEVLSSRSSKRLSVNKNNALTFSLVSRFEDFT